MRARAHEILLDDSTPLLPETLPRETAAGLWQDLAGTGVRGQRWRSFGRHAQMLDRSTTWKEIKKSRSFPCIPVVLEQDRRSILKNTAGPSVSIKGGANQIVKRRLGLLGRIETEEWLRKGMFWVRDQTQNHGAEVVGVHFGECV